MYDHFYNASVSQQVVYPKGDENILEKDFAMMQAADYSSVIMLRSSQSMSLS